MALLYTKFQLNWTLTVGGVTRKRKSLQTDRRTDGRTPRGITLYDRFSKGRIKIVLTSLHSRVRESQAKQLI